MTAPRTGADWAPRAAFTGPVYAREVGQTNRGCCPWGHAAPAADPAVLVHWAGSLAGEVAAAVCAPRIFLHIFGAPFLLPSAMTTKDQLHTHAVCSSGGRRFTVERCSGAKWRRLGDQWCGFMANVRHVELEPSTRTSTAAAMDGPYRSRAT